MDALLSVLSSVSGNVLTLFDVFLHQIHFCGLDIFMLYSQHSFLKLNSLFTAEA